MSIELPPLNGFYVFESAARHLSFTLAAKELFVTQAAVSQQIKQLESQLGFKLFHRLTRQLALTEEGKRLANEVRLMLTRLSNVIDELKAEESSGTLTVSTISSFAMKWLIPRLQLFHQEYPEISLQLHTSNHPVDFRTENIDMAVRYGRGNYKGVSTTFMMRDQIFPVCSPELLKSKGPIKAPADLCNHVLLYDSAQDQLTKKERDWSTWFTKVGVTDFQIRDSMSLSGTHMALEAAIAGQGFALGRTSIASHDLKLGRLVRPFNYRVEADNAYYIVSPTETADKPKVKIFREWLLENAKHKELRFWTPKKKLASAEK